MSFKEFMQENGYELKTTFWDDFTIADAFGEAAISDTYSRAFDSWKGDYVFLTELVLVLNHKIWQYHETNKEFAELYNELWKKADTYACKNLKGEELEYFYITLD